jgi:hypothetical protein
MGVLAIIMTLALQAAAPAITVEAPQSTTVETGGIVTFTVRVDLAALSPNTDVRLRPLALHNLKKLGAESGSVLVAGDSGQIASRWFRFTLSPTAAGAAKVGPIEAEVIVPGEAQPRILSAEGFTLQAVEPFDLNKLPAWIPWTFAGVILGLVWLFFGRLVTRKVRNAPVDEAAEERRRTFDDLASKLRRGDYREAADSAFGIILSAFKKTDRDPATAASDGELRAALRLGEEVRYAGYKPDRGEAAFIVRIARNESDRLLKTTKGQGDEHGNNRTQREGQTGK